jgi:phosphoserine phosphatase RsbU/P
MTPLKNIRWSLAFKLSLLILTSTAIIFAVAFEYDYRSSKRIVLKNVEESTQRLTQTTVNRMEIILGGVRNLVTYLAIDTEKHNPPRADLLRHISDVLLTDGNIFGCSVAFEPFVFDPSLRRYSPYTYREEDRLNTVNPEIKVNYFELDWYRIPGELGKPCWSEPYMDHFGAWIKMSTYSAPFYRTIRGKRTFQGVVIADMSLTWLDDIFSKLSIYRSGYAFMISRQGVFMTHPKKEWIMKESIFSIADKAGDAQLKAIGRSMIDGQTGFVALQSHFTKEKSWMYFAPLPSSGWSIGVVVPEAELFADVVDLRHEIVFIGLTGFLLLFTVIVAISRKITQPLRLLADNTREIAQGNLDIELPQATTRDEVGDLAVSFEGMRLALKEYIVNLRETTAAKERYESELKIARNIQMSFLPKRFPPFPDNVEFDIFAAIEPAREVGGDLYDFFLIDREHLFFSIGDVSGKGVPAALFMAVAKILMKGHAGTDMDPSEILAGANTELCIDNDSMMFVTVFCGILNFKTGELKYSNAGHNPPIIIRSDGGRFSADWLPLPAGFFLAIMEDAAYKTETVTLQPGDRLFLYTDGVTEAMNEGEQPYSDERLLQFIAEREAAMPETLIHAVMHDLKAFTGDAPQSDDITMVALHFRGSV